MFFSYCWHRPGRLVGKIRTCRFCRVAIEECPCVEYARTIHGKSDCACEASGWVGIVRSKLEALRQIMNESLPPKLSDWPEEWLYEFYERWNIREFDGGMESRLARKLAETEIRTRYAVE